jgi:hypothetical protein
MTPSYTPFLTLPTPHAEAFVKRFEGALAHLDAEASLRLEPAPGGRSTLSVSAPTEEAGLRAEGYLRGLYGNAFHRVFSPWKTSKTAIIARLPEWEARAFLHQFGANIETYEADLSLGAEVHGLCPIQVTAPTETLLALAAGYAQALYDHLFAGAIGL